MIQKAGGVEKINKEAAALFSELNIGSGETKLFMKMI